MNSRVCFSRQVDGCDILLRCKRRGAEGGDMFWHSQEFSLDA